MITQHVDLFDPQRFRAIIVGGIDTAEQWLSDGEKALLAGQFDIAEELWSKAWSNMQWIALNVIQRRLRIGKNESAEIRTRLRELWKRMMLFGFKKKIAAKTVVAPV